MNKGIVMEVAGKSVIVLTPDGQFKRLRRYRGHCRVGEEIHFPVSAPRLAWPSLRITSSLAAALLIGIIVFSTIGLFAGGQAAVAYVSIEINPGVELGIDIKKNVVEARGLDPDGILLLQSIEYKNKPLSEVTAAIVGKADEQHYFDREEAAMVVTSTIVAQKPGLKEETLNQVVKQQTQKVLAEKHGQGAESKVAITTLATPKEVRDQAKSEGLSTGGLAVKLLAGKPQDTSGSDPSAEDTKQELGRLLKQFQQQNGQHADGKSRDQEPDAKKDDRGQSDKKESPVQNNKQGSQSDSGKQNGSRQDGGKNQGGGKRQSSKQDDSYQNSKYEYGKFQNNGQDDAKRDGRQVDRNRNDGRVDDGRYRQPTGTIRQPDGERQGGDRRDEQRESDRGKQAPDRERSGRQGISDQSSGDNKGNADRRGSGREDANRLSPKVDEWINIWMNPREKGEDANDPKMNGRAGNREENVKRNRDPKEEGKDRGKENERQEKDDALHNEKDRRQQRSEGPNGIIFPWLQSYR